MNQALDAAIDILGAVPDMTRFPTMDQMIGRTRTTLARYSELVELRTIGSSRAGDPIQMLSIGDGPLSALFIGAPHPNEPVGCLSIEHFIERLCTSAALRAALPFRWHFVKAIEPDALRLNEGWFDRPGDLRHYLDHFFRPPLIDQAEYSFPYETDLGIPVLSNPENVAYRRALQLALPNLLYSLHNTDYGGVFYVVPDPIALLMKVLQGQPASLGLKLNVARLDEGFGEMDSFVGGVYPALDVHAIARRQRISDKYDDSRWRGGDSSFGYAKRRGVFSMMTEVSLWNGSSSHDAQPSGYSEFDVMNAWRKWLEEVTQIGHAFLETAGATPDMAHSMLLRAARDGVERAIHGKSAPSPRESEALNGLTYRVRKVGKRLATLRMIAHIRRAALETAGARAHVAACDTYLSAAIPALQGEFGLQAQPLGPLVAAQLHAILAAAAWLANDTQR